MSTKTQVSTNLIFYIEFNDGTETAQWSFDNFHGVPVPAIGDCICPGKGEYKIVNRTFAYDDSGFMIYFLCEAVPEPSLK